MLNDIPIRNFKDTVQSAHCAVAHGRAPVGANIVSELYCCTHIWRLDDYRWLTAHPHQSQMILPAAAQRRKHITRFLSHPSPIYTRS